MTDSLRTNRELKAEVSVLRKRIRELEEESSGNRREGCGRAEAALRACDIHLNKLFQHVPGMIYQFKRRPDATYCVPFATEAIRDLYGCSPEDVGEDLSPITSVILPEDLDNFLGSIEYSTKHMTTWTCEYRVHIPGQPIRWLYGHSTPEKLADGSIVWHGFNTDITDRKRGEERLYKSERKFSSIFHLSPDPMAISDVVTSIYIDVNQAFARWTGYSREEVIGVSALDLHLYVNPKDRERITGPLTAIGEVNGEEIMMRHKSGNVRNILFSARFIEIEQERYMLSLAHDITERRRAEEDLRQAEERYRSIFENAQEGIYQTTPGGRFIMANQAMARMLGYDSPEEFIADVIDIAHQLYVDPAERTKFLEVMERQGFARNHEVQFYRKDGRAIWVSLSSQPVRAEDGQILYYEGIIQDITDRKERVARLREALGGTIRAIASVVEARDPYTAGHQRRVSDLARAIATEMGLSAERIEGLRIASTIHDIGKVSVPAEILSMPRELRHVEFALIKTHVQSGYDILKDVEFPWPIARMILEHHERMDGSGYPNGLTGDNLLLESRILSVADVVEGMATHRPYRAALGIYAALEDITRNKGVLYDPAVVTACLRLFKVKGYQLKK